MQKFNKNANFGLKIKDNAQILATKNSKISLNLNSHIPEQSTA